MLHIVTKCYILEKNYVTFTNVYNIFARCKIVNMFYNKRGDFVMNDKSPRPGDSMSPGLEDTTFYSVL